MKSRILMLLLLSVQWACTDAPENSSEESLDKADEITFDEKKWKTRKGQDYPYREQMVNDVLYSKEMRALKKDELLDVLGEPTRTDNLFLFYRISQTRFGPWPMRTTTLVIKLTEADSVEWIKLHE